MAYKEGRARALRAGGMAGMEPIGTFMEERRTNSGHAGDAAAVGAEGADAALRTRVRAWLGSNEVRLFAVAVSLFVHVALLLLLANLIFERSMASASVGKNGETPLAVIADADLSELMEVGLAADVPTEDVAPMEMVTSEDFSAPVSDEALASLEVTDVGDLFGAGEDEMSEGMEGALGGGASASFFGVEARGTRFVYIVDISGSMADERLTALRQALGASIDGLLEHTQFAIVLYNSDAYLLTTRGWVPATDKSKRDVKRDLRGIQATGGTNPIPAFEIVFAMKPRPDAIYFMTDGEFGSNGPMVVSMVDRLNSRGFKRVPIHCITFIEDSGRDVMRTIAQRSGGTYTHVGSVSP